MKTRPALFQHSTPELGLVITHKVLRSPHFVRSTTKRGEKSLFWRSVSITPGNNGGVSIEWRLIPENEYLIAITPDSQIEDLAALYTMDPHRALYLAKKRAIVVYFRQ